MKKFFAFLCALLAVSLFAGCGGGSADASTPAASASEAAPSGESRYPLTFQDSLGTAFTLEKPLEKVIVLNRQTAEAVKLLGAEAVVIATGDTTITNNSYLGFGDLPDMGETGELNIEAIIGLNPDAVLVHTNRATEVLEEKLNPLGVKVIRIDNYQPERYDQEMRLLGKILDKEERAEEFLAYRVSVEKLVADQVQNIPEEERKTVMALSVGFINSNGGYRIFPCMANNGEAGVGEGYSTILAGGLDASPGTVWDPAQDNTTIHVEEEYALSCNPQVITLHGTWLGGYNATEPEAFTTVLDNIYNISSIGKMTAGENRDVYIFHTDMLGANKRHIGLLQLGKYLYPSRFGGIDAEAYAKEYFQDWLGTTYEGIWFYSAKDGQ